MILLDEKHEIITLNGRSCVSHDPTGKVGRALSCMLFKAVVSGVGLGFFLGRGGADTNQLPNCLKLAKVCTKILQFRKDKLKPETLLHNRHRSV